MGFIEVLIMILGLYSVLPRIYYFIEVLQISFGPIQKDLLRRYYDYNGESFAVIIGGTSGIGRELAIRFARYGFSIYLIGKNKCKLEEVKASILSESKVRVLTMCEDLANSNHDLYTSKIYKELKDLDVAIFVNNCHDSARGYFKDIPLDRLHK